MLAEIGKKSWNSSFESVRRLRRALATHLLENELASITRTASSHKKNGLKSGAEQYQSLWRTADRSISNFCEKYHVDRIQIEAQAPVIKQLHELAEPVETNSRKAVGALPIVVFLSVFFGGFICHALYYLFQSGGSLADSLVGILRHL